VPCYSVPVENETGMQLNGTAISATHRAKMS
jgi:hypothetical protein